VRGDVGGGRRGFTSRESEKNLLLSSLPGRGTAYVSHEKLNNFFSEGQSSFHGHSAVAMTTREVEGGRERSDEVKVA
jgi:hypothetical protein